MRSLLFLALVTSALRAQAAPRHTELPSSEELDSISLRGIELYEYDRAAWEATDALLKVAHPPHRTVVNTSSSTRTMTGL